MLHYYAIVCCDITYTLLHYRVTVCCDITTLTMLHYCVIVCRDITTLTMLHYCVIAPLSLDPVRILPTPIRCNMPTWAEEKYRLTNLIFVCSNPI